MNVIRTGVRFDSPCPAAPDDGWEWMAVIVDDEWRLLRCVRKSEALSAWDRHLVEVQTILNGRPPSWPFRTNS